MDEFTNVVLTGGETQQHKDDLQKLAALPPLLTECVTLELEEHGEEDDGAVLEPHQCVPGACAGPELVIQSSSSCISLASQEAPMDSSHEVILAN